MPEPHAARLLTRLSEAGLHQKQIADLVDRDRSLVSHWSGGRRPMPMDAMLRLCRELARRWPERRLFWAELLLGDLVRLFGCRLVPADDAPRPAGRLVYLDEAQCRQLAAAGSLLSNLSEDTP